MMLARSGKWYDGSDGNHYLVYRCIEVAWSLADDDTLDCHRGEMYYETSTGLRVIRVGVKTFKVMSTGVYLFDEEKQPVDIIQRKHESRLSPMHSCSPLQTLSLAFSCL